MLAYGLMLSMYRVRDIDDRDQLSDVANKLNCACYHQGLADVFLMFLLEELERGIAALILGLAGPYFWHIGN